jgi:hypothetical protein
MAIPIWAGSPSNGETTRTPGMAEPGAATSVTSWPAVARPAACSAMTRSMPPWAGGGMGIHGGARSPMRMR